MLTKISLIAVCMCFSAAGFSQTKKPAEKCDGACCKKETKSSTAIKPAVMLETEKKKEVSCKLTSPELRKRKEEVIAVIKTKILDKQELADGYKYKFEATDDMLDQLTAFLKSERACCDFFDFNLSLSDKIVWLSITGPDGAKGFIKTEMDF
ncbi:MAG: hypothetical protein J0I32_04710 [Sphingobacteriales bacterium]|nr:hypothetical protein [Sphingobacteriales bacterium]OJV98460.1 MAG: hypothetical protein BGO52_11785 [Sphingobacteriales bacterium 44-61]